MDAQSCVNCMTFVNYAEGLGASTTARVARMVNKAGTLVQPTIDALESAMADFEADFESGNIIVDILDAPGTNSWPMAYFSYLAMAADLVTDDCTAMGELLDFISWIYTNDAYV
jgi:hypothetical protein